MWPRASYQMGRPRRRVPTNHLCLSPSRHLNARLEVPGHGIRDRCDLQPESVPRYPRDLTQPGLPVRFRQPIACHLRKPPYRTALQRSVQSMYTPPEARN